MKKSFVLFFAIVSSCAISINSFAADDAQESKSVIENNLLEYPLGHQEKPLGFKEYPLQYEETPRGFLEIPRNYNREPLNFRNTPPNTNTDPENRIELPPGFVERQQHRLANLNPSNQILLDNHWIVNKNPELYITPENHPLKSIIYPREKETKKEAILTDQVR